jgi:hypothetical protein
MRVPARGAPEWDAIDNLLDSVANLIEDDGMA